MKSSKESRVSKHRRSSRERSRSRKIRRHGRSRERSSSGSRTSISSSGSSRSRDRYGSRSWKRERLRSRSESSESRLSTERRRSRSRSRNRRRSRSHSYDRRRSRSRSYDRRRSRSRSRSRNKKKRSERRRATRERTPDMKISEKIGAVKARMRSALDSVSADIDKSFDTGPSTSNVTKTVDLGLTLTETVSRHRDIERIEQEGFHQSIFISSAGGAGGRVKTEDPTDRDMAIEKKENTHDKAMFGPKWGDPVKKDENEEDVSVIEMRKETPLAHPRFSEDPAIREARWLQLYRERRAKLLCL